MRLVIREYLSMLKEEGELDALLPDVLLAMDITPTSKPQKGVRQFGVDLEAKGKALDDDEEKLYLFVIKQGNIDRDTWDGDRNAVRPTLNEIMDVYLDRIADESPKKIVVCSNGEMNQSTKTNWDGYVKDHQKDDLEFEYWGADKLAELIDNYFLDEYLFPESSQKEMRKTLALLDLPDYDLSYFNSMIERILFDETAEATKLQVKSLRLAHLCLNMVSHWASEADNLKPAFEASERVLLRIWDWLRIDESLENKALVSEFAKIYASHIRISRAYFHKIRQHCYIRDGLTGYPATEIEYPLRVFEQIGILSIIGLQEWHLYLQTKKYGHLRYLIVIADSLINLIKNNPPGKNPPYDGHIIAISLAFRLLYEAKKCDFAEQWLQELINSITIGYKLLGKFPNLSDSYQELIEIEVGGLNVDFNSSTLLPVLAEWTVVFEREDLYQLLREATEDAFSEVNYQTWYPDDDIEEYLYKENALNECGDMRTGVDLYPEFDEFKSQMMEEFEKFESPEDLSFIRHGFPIMGLIASRHFRTPVFPFYWRELLNEKSDV